MNSTDIVPNAAKTGTDELHLDQFDGDEQDWFIMQYAIDQGADPHAALARVRAAQSPLQPRSGGGQGGSGSVVPVAAVAPAQPPAGSVPFPPGVAGEIARFIFASAPRPVTEVAIVAALGLLAGVCGRQWHVLGSGLNLYLVLIGRSAIGKEAMHRGVSKLARACQQKFQNAYQFVRFDDFASGQALIKGCIETRCFVNVVGELGHKFTAMAKDTDPAMRTLRRTMTNLYSKSGPEAIAGGIAYSNQENNAKVDFSVAYSLIGETTPARFFESITSDMMSDGFLSRFNFIEYVGDRPEKNPAPLDEPDEALVGRLADIMQQAQALDLSDKFQRVERTPEVVPLVNAFSTECDSRIREAGDDEARRQMWNRAELKALRIAAVLAVADNYLAPRITVEHFEWALLVIRRDIAGFAKRLQSGEIGEGSDDRRESKLLELCHEFLAMQPQDVPNYARAFEELRRNGLVTRKYLQIRTQRLAAFEKHPRGQKVALDMAIQTAIDNGHFRPVQQTKVVDDFGFHGKVYAVLNTGKFRHTNWMQAFLDACELGKT